MELIHPQWLPQGAKVGSCDGALKTAASLTLEGIGEGG